MNYWLWIIPSEVSGLWDFCRQQNIAAMEYQVGINPKAEHHYKLARQIVEGDKIIAYLNQNLVGGVGTVTKRFFEESQGYQSSEGYPYRHRIGVDWITPELPIDVRKLPSVNLNQLSPKLFTQTIHSVTEEVFAGIADAVQIVIQNPLPGIAELLETVPLTDIACRDAKHWAAKIEPVTRPFLKYVGSVIEKGLRVQQGKMIQVNFKKRPHNDAVPVDTRDNVYITTSVLTLPGVQSCYYNVYCGRDIRTFEDKLVWGLFWLGRSDLSGAIEKHLDFIKIDEEILIRPEDTTSSSANLAVLKFIPPEQLRKTDPIELAYQIFRDVVSFYQRVGTITSSVRSRSLISEFMQFIQNHGFYFPQQLVVTYYLSLQTKPFVILTGISGTGKTKLAQLFAEWMSPTVEKEVEQAVAVEPNTDSFTITVQPYMLKYSRIVIPVDYWAYFPILEGDEKARVRVRVKDFEEDCQLGRYPRGKGTNRDPIYWLFKGKVRDWMQNELQVGDMVEVLCPADEEDPVYTFRKYERAQKQQVKVKKDYTTFISVRPDWTDNRGLLGFYNLITGAYQTTDFLRLLVQATIEDDQPHFVILDEMNLAKVEYYFADFLSVLESRYLQDGKLKQERLRLHDLPRCVLAQGEASWDELADPEATDQQLCRVRCGMCPLRDGLDEIQRTRGESDYEDARKSGFDPLRYVPPRMPVPRNVYFSGTVNVDETTYMFSPKVLDRANTIEFNAVDLERYFAEETARGGAALPAGDAARDAFTFDGAFVQLPKEAPLRTEPILATYRERLRDLNARLQLHMFHFGYRVADEILLYLWNAHTLHDPDFGLDVAFDYQIYQKILPKFHGSQAKLEEPLAVVREFCETHGYMHSRVKVEQMLAALRKEGFTSFA